MRTHRLTRAVTLPIVLTVVIGAAAACSSGGDSGGGASTGGGANTLNLWTADTLADRVAATKKILAGFTAKTGITVNLTGVAEDQFNQVLTSSAAAGTLPDVWGSISLTQIRTLSSNEFTDTQANADVIKQEGENTFSARALALTKDGDQQVGIPTDSWAQLLFYRKDLFDKAGLAAPKTYADITAAAKALNSPPNRVGFVGPTKPGDAFTDQSMESIALANNCQLVDKSGNITITSPACVNAFTFYRDLINNESVPGNQDVNSVRATYFAGKSAMFIWSTFVLDEMAGLRDNAKPSCPECVADPAFLAKNTGIVPALQGPDASQPAEYGQVVSWTILKGDKTDAAKKLMDYLLNDGYKDWIAIAPEGKVPVRKGTPSEPTKFLDEWKALPIGVDRKAPMSQLYSPEVISILEAGPDNFDRWGFEEGQGKLIGALGGTLPIAAAVAAITNDKADVSATLAKTADAIKQVQGTLK